MSSQILNFATLKSIGLFSLVLLGFAIELFCQPIAPKDSQSTCLGQLNTEIKQLIAQPQFNHAWISVVAAESNVENNQQNSHFLIKPYLINLSGDHYFIPASSLKLFTTAAALKILSPEYQIATRILSGESANDGTLNHDLIIEGNGDRSFSSASLQNLIAQLKNRGVKTIKGKLILSDRLQAKLPIGWEWNDLQEEYAAVPHGFTINGNVLNWQISPASQSGKPLKFIWQNPELAKSWTIENRSTTQSQDSQFKNSQLNSELAIERSLGKEYLKITGSLKLNNMPELGATAVPDPLTHFRRLLEIELANQKIAIANQSTPGSKPTTLYAQTFSIPLKVLIRTINKESDNLYAENLYQIIFQQKPGKWQQFWQAIGIPIDQLRIYDGSGLSRQNAIRGYDLIKLLQIMAKDQNFRDSLAIAGKDGTLNNRLKNTTIWAKSGTMSAVSVLAGYLKPVDYPELAFVVAINHGSLKNKDNQNLIDAIALTMTSLKSCD